MTTPNWDDNPDEIEIDLQYYFHILRSNWKLIAAVAFGAALIALIASQFITPIYRSKTTLYIDAGQSTSKDLGDTRYSQSLAPTYVEMLTSRPILIKTIDTLDLQGVKVGALRSSISVNPVANTQLMRIQVENSNPQQAADIANTLAKVFIADIHDIQTESYTNSENNFLSQFEYLDGQIKQTETALNSLPNSNNTVVERNRLEDTLAQYNRDYTGLVQSYEKTRLAKLQATSIIRPIEEAIPANDPISPRILLNTILGLVLGLMAAVGLVFARELLNDTIRDPESLGRKYGVPILGQVPNFDAENQKLVTATQPRSPVAESFRALRLNLRYASVDSGLRSILVTSAAPSEGKSTMASNLCVALAQGGQEVILVDGDLRRPRVHKNLDVKNSSGLSDLFIESLDALPDMLQATIVDNLSVLTSGSLPPNPSELLDTAKSRQIIEAATDIVDMVVIDAPPIVAMTDAVALSQYVDGVVLVIRAGKTRQSAIETAVGRLRHVNANLLGFAITDIDNTFQKGNYYYYKYYQDYHNAYQTYYDDEPEEDDNKPTKKRRKKKSSKDSAKKPEGKLARLLSIFNL